MRWDRTGATLSHALVRCLAVDPTDDDVVYAGTDRGLYVSTNGGRTWYPRVDGIPRAPVYALLAITGPPTRVAIATGAGTFETPDRGKTWIPIAPELATGIATALAHDSLAGTLLVGTYGAGLTSPVTPRSRAGGNEVVP
jgi:photosystem II stability/assembly factor-like uncharacterized protein